MSPAQGWASAGSRASNIGEMSLPVALRLEAPPGPAAMMRLVTIILALMMVLLGVLAAHHAQTAQGEAGHAIVAEFETAHQPLAAGGAAPDIAAEHLAVGLAAGCIVLIACCALGLALLASRAWRADLFRRPSTVAQQLRTVILGAASTTLTTISRPSLVALSISRT
jgi:hypothetical protein